MSGPSAAQIAALHAALYKRDRIRALSEHSESITTLMNLNPTAHLQSNDIRGPAGSGPTWFLKATGALSTSVAEAAQRCESIATVLLEIRDDVRGVDFPAADKQHLLNAIGAEAASWSARGRAWGASKAPASVDSAVAPIDAHLTTAATEIAHVEHYLLEQRDVHQ